MMDAFESRYAHVEVLGEVILTIASGLQSGALFDVLLEKYGLSDVQPGNYYPFVSLLRIFADCERRMPTVLKLCGKHVAEFAPFAPGTDTFEKIVMAEDEVYRSVHRGWIGEEAGHIRWTKISDTEYHLADSIPYPCLFHQGTVEGLAQKLGLTLSIEHIGTNCRMKGDAECTYRVMLKQGSRRDTELPLPGEGAGAASRLPKKKETSG
jgi:hypothetical protein